MNEPSEAVVNALRFQHRAGATSPLYRHVLTAVLADIDRGGPCAAVLAEVDPALEPVSDAVSLRFLGAVHRLVLEGQAPALARHYPSVGGTFDPERPDDALGADFIATVEAHTPAVVAGLARPVQTNEVARSAVLLPGYLSIARHTGLPLRVLEVGSSAGLNLRWDRYRYEGGADGSAWGPPDAALRFTGVYDGELPDLAVDAVVAERRGCDANPIDPTTPDGRLSLQSFVWPDQPERHDALRAALAVAADVPALVEHADAGEWVEARLREPVDDVATVLVHSIVWQYLPAATRRRIHETLEAAGREATPSRPLAWLRMEPGEDFARAAEVRLTTWPGGHERLVARAGYHGHFVKLYPD